MSEGNPLYTPGTGPEFLTMQPDEALLDYEDMKLYQSIMDSMMYLGKCTRFDVTYAVKQLTRTKSKTASIHMTAAKHLLLYLKANPELGI